MKTKCISVLALLSLITFNLGLWAYLNRPLEARSWESSAMGISFNPLRRHHDPEKGLFPTAEEIDSDLALLEDKFHAIRIYSVTNGQELIPEMAEQRNLNVAAGAWIGKDLDANEKEINSLISLSRYHGNIVRNLVGNEAILRKDVSVDQLIQYLRQVRKRTWLPVSTSETWNIWLAHPELADEVDFIAAHILPYWEGIPMNEAISYVFDRYQALRDAFPDKPIVLTEVGWPSNGQPIKQASASLAGQARFLREFLNFARDKRLVYYVVEAFDQPWKMSLEGSSGGYWGIYDAYRQPKFSMEGDIFGLPTWKNWATGAAILSALVMMLFLAFRRRLMLPGKLFFGIIANLSASTIAWSASVGAYQYQTFPSAALWIILLIMQALALLVILVEGLEIAEVLWQRRGGRNFRPLRPPQDHQFPKVSLHLPIHNEPPEMVRQTLEALAYQDYPDLEVLVIDNNTTDPRVWMPVRDMCARLGSRFRFFHLENWPGFKAGALNYALEQTATDAEVVAVIDSDYKVKSNWLKSLVPYFERPEVGFVQAPQDYRDWQDNRFKNFCHWEYAGFFRIGMVQRNEFNAIIQHGTMTLVRKSALEAVGNWGEWCICEDSELGLRLYRSGYDSVYIKESFGQGLTPDTLSSYITQRYRWVYGAMQILKRHWRAFLPGRNSDLTGAQRYYFLAGWLPWFSDALALIFTVASLLLTARILIDPIHGELPVAVFVVPTIGLFGFKILRSMWMYRARVKCGFAQTLGAAIAGLALTHTVAKATLQGLITSGRPFLRTPKCEKRTPLLAGLSTIREELLFLFLLWSAAISVSSLEHFDNLSGNLWTIILLVQSTPYAASLFTLLVNVMPKVFPVFVLETLGAREKNA